VEIEIKIYLVVGMGYVIGEPLHDWKNKIVLKNAGIVRGNDKQISVTPPIIHWFAHQLDKIQRLEIPKHLIIDEDDPIPEVLRTYEMYIKKVNEQVSGIKIATEQDLSRLKIH
jgi:hypothetical protein